MVSQADRNAIASLVQQLGEKPEAHLTVEDLASRINMSVSRFKVKFKIVTGSTPHKFLRGLLLEKSKMELKHSSNSISQIARNAGYKSIWAFEQAFRKLTGMLPSDYRNKGFLLLYLKWAFLIIDAN